MLKIIYMVSFPFLKKEGTFFLVAGESSNINEGIKAVFFFKKKDGTGKLVKVSSYIPTFTKLLNPSEYANLPVPQIHGEF